MTRRSYRVLLLGSAVVAGCGDTPAPPAPAVVAATSRSSDADRVAAADVSILFVGNSHTGMHNLPELVCEMIRFLDPKKTTYSYYIGVGHLEQVAHDPACRTEIESRLWKVVVLQAQKISVSGKFAYSRTEGTDLARLAKGRGASVVFYPEWGLKGKAGDGERQEAVYREMARAAGVRVAPVAKAWDRALAERPELPLHDADGNHQSAVGAFLTACVLAGRITETSPAPLAAFPYAGANEEQRRFLADVAAKTLAAETGP